MYYVYILKSCDYDEIYLGSTNDLRRRVEEHNQGSNSSTKAYTPWKLVYYEAYLTEDLAREREKKLKHHGKGMQELKKRIGLN